MLSEPKGWERQDRYIGCLGKFKFMRRKPSGLWRDGRAIVRKESNVWWICSVILPRYELSETIKNCSALIKVVEG